MPCFTPQMEQAKGRVGASSKFPLCGISMNACILLLCPPWRASRELHIFVAYEFSLWLRNQWEIECGMSIKVRLKFQFHQTAHATCQDPNAVYALMKIIQFTDIANVHFFLEASISLQIIKRWMVLISPSDSFIKKRKMRNMESLYCLQGQVLPQLWLQEYLNTSQLRNIKEFTCSDEG